MIPNPNCDTWYAFNTFKECRSGAAAKFDQVVVEKASDSQTFFCSLGDDIAKKRGFLFINSFEIKNVAIAGEGI